MKHLFADLCHMLIFLPLISLALSAVCDAFRSPASPLSSSPTLSRPLSRRTARRLSPQMLTNIFKPSVDAASLKREIGRIAKGKDNGIKVTPAEREKILSLVKQLESSSPIKAAAQSKRLNGLWRLVYTTTPGSSAGKLGPFVGDVTQMIDMDSDVYINYVDIGPVQAFLEASWDVLGPNRWRVKFQNIGFRVFGIPLAKNELKNVGDWRMTYLDDDYRILWARGSRQQPDASAMPENVYVLRRVS
ncbi:unnamed protein product [Vitrella brassicaformis CCMP3155]|uniref:Plastid lipid-associated protein/fibrillin conserved domain-containing protein n=2 Tax=Vitrella brassicaformis TaxID=1169539 RepID=A0A0G4E8H9_VITBC|nr:unnamed protein product [Vitrella brassicaformis CCMP3155]|eukprot:CEL91638.1 unnamed protein product [Vitrella brassicaformis CCMP3155]